jgi:hypothetical protein
VGVRHGAGRQNVGHHDRGIEEELLSVKYRGSSAIHATVRQDGFHLPGRRLEYGVDARHVSWLSGSYCAVIMGAEGVQ